MRIPLTAAILNYPVVIIEMYLKCFPELVSHLECGMTTERVEISSFTSIEIKEIKRAHIGSALI